MFGIEFARSKQSKSLSHVSIGSPEAYLIDSLNSIFLNSLPTDQNNTNNRCQTTTYMEVFSEHYSLNAEKVRQLLLELDALD